MKYNSEDSDDILVKEENFCSKEIDFFFIEASMKKICHPSINDTMLMDIDPDRDHEEI